MLETQKPNTMHWASETDYNFISSILKFKNNKRLLLDGLKPNGKKNNYWQDISVDLKKHLTGEIKQGGNLCYEENGNKVAKAAVCDVDEEIDPHVFCRTVFAIDTTAIPIRSPSGKNWHIWKFYNAAVPVKEAATWAKDIGFKIEAKNWKVDFGKCNPNFNGSDVGINFPFGNNIQVPYDPRGETYSCKNLKHRIRFNNFPYIAAATNLKSGKNRYDAALFSASMLYAAGKYKDEYLDAIIENFGTKFDDDKKLKKIKAGEYKNYTFKPSTIEQKIGEMIGVKDFKFNTDTTETEIDELLTPLELFEYTGKEILRAREWVIKGWLLKKALTLLVGQAGVGKTIFIAQLAAALAYGGSILGKKVLETGNVLILASEETQNELRLRIKAIVKLLELTSSDQKIFMRGLEDQIKLVNFTMDKALKTKEYKRLELSIKKYQIKYILLDPLISFQTGAYDENNNAKMEQFVKDFIIPLAVKNNGAVIAGHHTNKFSMISIEDDGELVVDHQIALNSARGASSLVAAARFVLAFQPMTKKLFNKKFEPHLKDGSKFTNYAGLIEAKSNYNVVEDDINWLKKNSVSLEVVDEAGNVSEESLGVFTTTDLNKISKAKNKLKAEQNEQFVRANLHIIKTLMEDDECTLNAAVEKLVAYDPAHADPDVEEGTIKTRIRRQLENGLNGKADSKNGLTNQGISFDDGYNYWIARDHSKHGAAKIFIRRGKDFKR